MGSSEVLTTHTWVFQLLIFLIIFKANLKKIVCFLSPALQKYKSPWQLMKVFFTLFKLNIYYFLFQMLPSP